MMKRKPLMTRKPAVVIAIGAAPSGGEMKNRLRERLGKGAEDEKEYEEKDEDTLTCPKCGAELADTDENRQYAKMRGEDMKESSDEESEYEESED